MRRPDVNDASGSDLEIDAHKDLMLEWTRRVGRRAEPGVGTEFVHPVFVADERVEQLRLAPEGTDIKRQAMGRQELRSRVIAEAVEDLRQRDIGKAAHGQRQTGEGQRLRIGQLKLRSRAKAYTAENRIEVGIGGGEGRHASLRDAVVVPFLVEVDLQGQITRYVERDLRTEDHCTFLRSEGIVVGFQIAAEAERDVLDRAERKDCRVREGVAAERTAIDAVEFDRAVAEERWRGRRRRGWILRS